MTLDVERTTYHETEDRIWRIDSGTDYGNLWDLDVFENHAEDYLGKDEEAQTDSVGAIEILEADFEERGYKLIKDNKADGFIYFSILKIKIQIILNSTLTKSGRMKSGQFYQKQQRRK